MVVSWGAGLDGGEGGILVCRKKYKAGVFFMRQGKHITTAFSNRVGGVLF